MTLPLTVCLGTGAMCLADRAEPRHLPSCASRLDLGWAGSQYWLIQYCAPTPLTPAGGWAMGCGSKSARACR